MRRQVHTAQYGNTQISPSDKRYVSNIFGRYGIWALHKRFVQESRLRKVFLSLNIAWLIFLATCTGIYLFVGS